MKLVKIQDTNVTGIDKYRLMYQSTGGYVGIATVRVDRQTNILTVRTSRNSNMVFHILKSTIWQLIEDMAYPDVVEMLANITKEDIIHINSISKLYNATHAN